MVKKKWLIAIIILIGAIGIFHIAWRLYNFPFNATIRNAKLYDKIRYCDVEYINGYGFFPEALPDQAKDMKWFAFSGVMQAKAHFTLSFIINEDFFKKELQRWNCYNVYLYDKVADGPECVFGNEKDPHRWFLAEEHYTGEAGTSSDIIRDYDTRYGKGTRYINLDIPDIPQSEYPYTCIYVVDEHCYIAYSSKSGRIVYHMDTDFMNPFGDSSLSANK